MAIKFVIHEITLSTASAEYLDSNTGFLEAGFSSNSPAVAAAVNAVLHETSLVITALAENIGTFNPNDSLATIKAALNTYFVNTLKPDHATEADYVAHKLSFAVNDTTNVEYDGSAAKGFGPIYAATSAGTHWQLLIAGANGIPTWTIDNSTSDSAIIGAPDEDRPIYIDVDGCIASCLKYAGGTKVTLNGNNLGANTASFYAPESAPVHEGQIVVSNDQHEPVWSSTIGDDDIPIYLDDDGCLQTCHQYANATAITLNGVDRYAQHVTIYAPTSNTSVNDNDYFAKTIWADDNGVPYFGKAPFMHALIDSAWAASRAICFAKTESNTYTGSADNSTLFAYVKEDFTANPAQTPSLKHVVSLNVNENYTGSGDPTNKISEFQWSFAGFASGNGIKMKLRKDASGIITFTVDGAINADSISATNSIQANIFIATSDARKKENIIDYVPAKSILDLPIKEFDYKSDKSHHIGCIAQDLQEIAPELVHEDAEGYLSIEETKLVYLLLNEVKKLRKELDELKGSK